MQGRATTSEANGSPCRRPRVESVEAVGRQEVGRRDDLRDQGKRPLEVARGVMEPGRNYSSNLDGGLVRYDVKVGSLINGKAKKVTGEEG